jgi:tetratricopeptide (TPR) repeat protein
MYRTLIRRAAPLCLAALAALAATATIALPARAADSPATSTPAKVDKLTPVRALIADRRWREAITALQQLNDTGSADWQNLMGYAHRKASPPDLPAAERHYDEALRIDPRHRGALEYSGELYLMQANLPRAEERLAALDKACLFGCEEYTDLKTAVARFKANGNRYLAKP